MHIMTAEAKNRVIEITTEIQKLQSTINDLQYEIEKINLKENANFTSKFICYFNGKKDEFVFMHVRKQIYRKNGTIVYLQGPAIILDNDPLENEYAEICTGRYDENCGIEINEKVITGTTFSKIRVISDMEFITVMDFWFKLMKKVLIK